MSKQRFFHKLTTEEKKKALNSDLTFVEHYEVGYKEVQIYPWWAFWRESKTEIVWGEKL